MMRRFVIGIDSLSTEQEAEFHRFLRDHGTWWHWISNMWLFVPKKEATIDVNAIREAVKKIDGGVRLFVMEISEDVDWVARGRPNAQGSRMGDWLSKQWAGEDE